MKNLFFFILIGLALCSCEKVKNEKNIFEFPCELGSCKDCVSDDYENPSLVGSDVKIYYLEPIEMDKEGKCIVGGYVKYLKDGNTVALVKYGLGVDKSYGIKTLCVNGDCDDPLSTTCTFETDCE